MGTCSASPAGYHTFLWFIAGDARLARRARQLIEEPANARYLSVASLWEMAIRASLGRLSLPGPPSTLVRDPVRGNAIDLLPIAPDHLDVLQQLPYHHRDPTGRRLIAQAVSKEGKHVQT